MLAFAAPAAAQTVTTFISNTGQTTDFSSAAVQAVAFTTGTGTYTLSSVGIFLAIQSVSPTPAVKIYGDTGGNPGTTLLATMTNPGTIQDNAVHTFTAPANTTLSASTTYWVVTSNSATTDGQGFRVGLTNKTLDTGTAPGWSLGNARFKNDIAATPWTASNFPLRFEIRGTGGTTTNNPPTVANTIPDQTATAGTAFQLCVSGEHVQRRGHRRHAELHGDESRRHGAAHVAGLRRQHAHLLGHAAGRGRRDGGREGDRQRRQRRVGQRYLRYHGCRRHHPAHADQRHGFRGRCIYPAPVLREHAAAAVLLLALALHLHWHCRRQCRHGLQGRTGVRPPERVLDPG